MGWCHEFGPQIHEGCSHPMVAGASSCSCAECGVVCAGRFNGCPAVWARGPAVVHAPRVLERDVIAQGTLDGRVAEDLTAVDFSLAPLFEAPSPPPAAPPPRPARRPPAAALPPRRRLPPRPLPPLSVPDSDGDRLAVLRARIEGLRGEVKALGDSIGHREPRTAAPAADSG